MGKILNIGHLKEEILLCLVRSGPQTAREISRETRIRQNKVYTLLKDLTERRLVESLPKFHKQKIYTLNKTELRKFVRRRKEQINSTLVGLAKIKDRIDSYPRQPIPRLSDEIWLGPPHGAIGQTRELLKSAKKSVIISTYMFSWYNDVLDLLSSKGITKGIPIHVFMTDPSSEALLSAEHRVEIQEKLKLLDALGVEVSFSNRPPPFRGTIVDRSICLIMMFPYRHEENRNTSLGYCICKNSALVEILINYLNSYFSDSTSTKSNIHQENSSTRARRTKNRKT